MKIPYYIFPLLLCSAVSCSTKPQAVDQGTAASQLSIKEKVYDFDEILNAGEIIVTTISGPETYFDYQGYYMGLQFALISHFARQNGLRVRVELAHDENEMVALLKNNEADVICYQLPVHYINKQHLSQAGAEVETEKTSWAVRKNSPKLSQALNDWYARGIIVTVAAKEKKKLQKNRMVRRKVRAPYISKSKGIISTYDDEFKMAAKMVGWDWRLIAAQCYQESGFDPAAESWAGAKGLMQIMPETAIHLNLPLKDIFDPKRNLAAAGRFLKELNEKFSDIQNEEERIKFILAAYNGGSGHIHDAMALARKDGKNAHLWSQVSGYVLKLSDARYYRDPAVQYGYMVGSETFHYVQAVLDRWRAYGGYLSGQKSSDSEGKRIRRKNRFSKETPIYHPGDPEFNQLNKQ